MHSPALLITRVNSPLPLLLFNPGVLVLFRPADEEVRGRVGRESARAGLRVVFVEEHGRLVGVGIIVQKDLRLRAATPALRKNSWMSSGHALNTWATRFMLVFGSGACNQS